MQEYKDVMIVKDGEYIIYLQSPCYQYKSCIDNKEFHPYKDASHPSFQNDGDKECINRGFE